ncbi:asparaginase [Massilia cavernae]|uniref:Asparaginase n=1 Tax=Massilia cavernae TaxID=2320864 RepID=A0A418Y5V0_9BURK|nr:asparaginase [Massilia cavernae]RJG22242.1 asparaginase [Massilia cavernae]
MQAVPLVETTRGYPATGNVVENIHLGSVAVVDLHGKLLWSAGDPHYMTFTRSALKPFQALPFMLADGPARFGLTRPELALLCASHSGEDKHLRAVESILGKIGMDESDLECGCAVPLYYEAVGMGAPQDRTWTQLHHNCSGKHSGFLAWCRMHGEPTDNYISPVHPLQQAIRTALEAETGLSGMPSGMDGCSAPNYALPLSQLAHLYARLAQGGRDPRLGSVMGDLFDAMTMHPDLVSGEARCDLHYMEAGAGDWVSKVGADAVQTIGIRSAGIGIAIKILDGTGRALHTATWSVLEQLGLLDARRAAMLEQYRRPALKNVRGSVVGDIRAAFRLHPHA